METVDLKLYDGLWIQFNTKNMSFLRALSHHFSDYVPNYYFDPRFQGGFWDGKISLFNRRYRTLPYGLLKEFLEFHRDNYPEIKLKIAPEVISLYEAPPIKEIKYDLKYEPRDYQAVCIIESLRHTKGIIRSYMASGKSLVIAYIIKILRDNQAIKRPLIIVPTITLINQFQGDLIDYGFDPKEIGLVGDKMKQFDKPIVISTWQSLMNRYDKLDLYDAVFVDETHNVKEITKIKDILSHMKQTKYRIGFTGTLYDERLHNLTVIGYLGPVLAHYTAADLSDDGWISECTIHKISIEYNDPPVGNYNEIKNSIFSNSFRLELIAHLINSLDDSVLVLVGLVQDEGWVLHHYLKYVLEDKEVIFLSGKDDAKLRDYWRQEFQNRKDIVLIVTYQIWQVGVNMPTLKYIMLASSFRSKIRNLQSIGRGLRTHESKEHGAHIIDFSENVRYLSKHAEERLRMFIKEGFRIVEYELTEGDNLQNFKLEI